MGAETLKAGCIVVDKSVVLVENPTTPYFLHGYTIATDVKAIGYAHRSSAAHTRADFGIATVRITTGKTT